MRRKSGICGIIFCFILLCAFYLLGDGADAVNYDQKIKEAQQEQKEYQKRSEEIQNEIEKIEQDKEDTLQYIGKLDEKSTALEEELIGLVAEVTETKKQLDEAKESLSEARKEEEKQYTTMKKRIKYMYENGDQEYLAILFSSESLADFLNRTEYISRISRYDKTLFEKYQKIRETVEEKEKEIETALADLEQMKAAVSEEKQALADIRKKKKTELKSYQNSLEKSTEQSEEYQKKAAEAAKQVEKLLLDRQNEIDRKNDMGGGNSGGDGSLRWPLRISGRISSGFGARTSPTAGASSYHKGIDIAAPSGTPIVAAAGGTVVTAAYSASAGNYVMISHGNRLYTVYMHCSSLAVKEGDTVKKSDVIAYVGSTGISTGSHLHFGVSKNGTYVNPLIYVKQGG